MLAVVLRWLAAALGCLAVGLDRLAVAQAHAEKPLTRALKLARSVQEKTELLKVHFAWRPTQL